MSSKLIQTWFAYACQQLHGVANSCLFVNDQSSDAFVLVESTSTDFSQSKYVHDNTQAVISRRKPVVTQVSAQDLLKQQSMSNTAAHQVVAEISIKNHLITVPLIIDKKIIGVVCFEFNYE